MERILTAPDSEPWGSWLFKKSKIVIVSGLIIFSLCEAKAQTVINGVTGVAAGLATSISGGSAGQYPYQTGVSTTGFRTPNVANGPVVLDSVGKLNLTTPFTGTGLESALNINLTSTVTDGVNYPLLYGGYFNLQNTSTNATTTNVLYGLNFGVAQIGGLGAGQGNPVIGISGQVALGDHTGAVVTTWDDVIGADFSAEATGAQTSVARVIGVEIGLNPNHHSATSTEADGLLVDNVTGAATNYAIHTGIGLNYFGDLVSVPNISGNSGAPSLSCGVLVTNSTSSNLAGTINAAGGTPCTTSLVITFATNRTPAIPHCVVSPQVGTLTSFTHSQTATALTIGATALSGLVDYICVY